MHKGQGGGGRAGGGVMGMSEACMERVGESAEEALTEARRSDGEEGAHLALYLLPQLWPLISAFLCANREEIPCHESPILISWQQFHSCSHPHQEGRSRLLVCIKASLLHFKVSKIEFVDFRRLLVYTPYALSSRPQKCPSLAILTEQAGEGKASRSAFRKGVTSLPPGKRILSKTGKSRELCGWRVSSLRDNGGAVFQANWELGRRRACPQPQDIAFLWRVLHLLILHSQ